ncbi:condensation domain-containing protein, partial [Gordonia sp. NPDC003424]
MGKLDKRGLPEPVIEAGEFVAAADDAEALVAGVFAELLGVERVSVTDSFFDLGGNSLSAMRLAARVGEALDVTATVQDIFEATTVRELVVRLSGRGVALAPVVAVEPRPDRIPLTFAQQRMWFINRLDPASPTYNIPAVLRLTGNLDVPALHSALMDVVARQEVLRTTFPPSVDGPSQLVHGVDEIGHRLDWAVVDSQAELEAAAIAGFDVTVDWPVRARLWSLPDNEHYFALVVHHIAADGESMTPLINDLVRAYIARMSGHEPDFDALPVQLADFALWQHRVLGTAADPESVVGEQLSYWSAQLAGLPEVLELPSDRSRPRVASSRGAHVQFEVPADVVTRIDQLANDQRVTPFIVVHAALAVLLARLSATDDIAVGTPVAGRGQAVLDPLIGMFVNTLVLRTHVREDQTFTDFLDGVRTVDLAAFAHADVPFETVVEHVAPVRTEAFAPLAQVWLSLNQQLLPEMGSGVAETDIGGLSISPVDAPITPAKVDLLIGMDAAGPGKAMTGSIVYAIDLFDAESVRTFATRFVDLLDALTRSPELPLLAAPILTSQELDRPVAVSGGVGVVPVVLGDVLGGAVSRWGSRPAVVD